MTTHLQPIKVYGGSIGPNPLKISIILEELGLPIDNQMVPFAELKKPGYEAINPNGRLPAIHDPNTGLTLWESGAIIEYIDETYDKENKLSFPAGSVEDYHARQWLYFQATGQGPYFGQAVWFKRYHAERLESAIERYVGEIKRVCGVLEGWLQEREWLVGNKMSYADLAFVSWHNAALGILGDEGLSYDEFPRMKGWLESMNERPVVKRLVEVQRVFFEKVAAGEIQK
ncbi:glutathione S-transferase family protein [Aspergillus stella-maris]|uniref:glutathione S-transferase family protein n=1 Tax=Aspergillus stella-maris TaxID=1810926 RepID=UPI003CCCC301